MSTATTNVTVGLGWLGNTPAIPPLEQGDHLTRDEFERRYSAMPENIKAELVEGRVYMSSPVRRSHGYPHAFLLGWAFTYCASTPGTESLDNTTLRLDLGNEPQPDVMLRVTNAVERASLLSSDDYIEGAPELVAEIAVTSASIDMHEKLDAYRRNGVREYLVWRVLDNHFDWFLLRGKDYVSLSPDQDGVFKSETFPGLWLDRPALLSAELPRVLATLARGLSTLEHQAYVELLARTNVAE